jgi:membrane-associated HD superfamily phosphohydrolase
MSALIIASHVKEGLEIGREYNLPQPVLDFIPMHHGTTRIEYFYRKAEELRRPEEPPVQEAEFRYPGPRPNSKETGILMLADSVEAAARSIDNPSHKRLESLVESIISGRISDNQLGQTDLTFNDLERIKDAFLSILMGIYHVRVKYPGQEEETPTGRLRTAPDATALLPATATPATPAPPTVSVKVPDPHNGDGAADLQPSPQADEDHERDVNSPPS